MQNKNKKKYLWSIVKGQRSIVAGGLTLIETIIYIALFSLMLTGVLLSVFAIIDGARRTTSHSATQEEGSFVMQKISWALDGETAPIVSGSGCNQTLTTSKASVRLHASEIEMQETLGSYLPITSSNVVPSCVQFRVFGVKPTSVAATTTIDGVDFAFTKYLRATF